MSMFKTKAVVRARFGFSVQNCLILGSPVLKIFILSKSIRYKLLLETVKSPHFTLEDCLHVTDGVAAHPDKKSTLLLSHL